MNTAKTLRYFAKIFFWIFAIYSVALSLLVLASIPAAITQHAYDLPGIVSVALNMVSSLGVVVLLYSYIYRHKFFGRNQDRLGRIAFPIMQVIVMAIVLSVSPANLSDLAEGLAVFTNIVITGAIILMMAKAPALIKLFKKEEQV